MTKNVKRRQKQTLQQLRKEIGERCYICGDHLSHKQMTRDHVFPKAFGYTLCGNMMPAHLDCNNEKGDRIPTSEEIKISIEAYENIGLVFNPRFSGESSFSTKHINYFIRNLPKEIAYDNQNY